MLITYSWGSTKPSSRWQDSNLRALASKASEINLTPLHLVTSSIISKIFLRSMLESNQLRRFCRPTGLHDLTDHLYFQRDSNSYLLVRSQVFYPLNYRSKIAQAERIELSPMDLESIWLP